MIIIKLQGLPLDAMSMDVRLYFEGLTIPDGGVHIVGGDDGTVFIEFASDEDARQAMSRDAGKIKNSPIKLLLSSKTEMQSVIDVARQQKQQFTLQQQQQQHHLHHHHNHHQQQQQEQLTHFQHIQQQHPQHQQSFQLQQQHQQPNLNNQPHLLNPDLQPMGPALLPQQQQQHHNNNHLQQQHQPSPFIDPRILSQNYQGILTAALNQQQQQQQPPVTGAQTLLPTTNHQVSMFNPQYTPVTTLASGVGGGLTMSLLGNHVGALGGADMNSVVLGGIGGNLLPNTTTAANNNTGDLLGNNIGNRLNVANRNCSPDQRARMSGMRGGDDKLFANKRCVLAASNIPYRATSKDIIEFLSEFNIKEDSIRRRYNQKGQPTADAKIAFSSPDAAMKALKMMNKKTLCGRPVFLKPV